MSLVRVNTGAVRRRAGAVVAGMPGIAAAYLFGSSLGDCQPDSDIDIGLFLAGVEIDSIEAHMLAGRVAARLEPIESHASDVNVVDPRDSIFAFRVISEGIALAVNDEERMTDLVEQISRDYCENGYRYRLAVEALIGLATHDDY